MIQDAFNNDGRPQFKRTYHLVQQSVERMLNRMLKPFKRALKTSSCILDALCAVTIWRQSGTVSETLNARHAVRIFHRIATKSHEKHS